MLTILELRNAGADTRADVQALHETRLRLESEELLYRAIGQVVRSPGPAPDYARWTFGPGRNDV